jgi:hypothetical protein
MAELAGSAAALEAGAVAAGCEAPQENAIGVTSPTATTIHFLGILFIVSCLQCFNPQAPQLLAYADESQRFWQLESTLAGISIAVNLGCRPKKSG